MKNYHYKSCLNNLPYHWLLIAAPVLIMLTGLFELPYGYYQLLRFVVAGCAAYIAFNEYEKSKAEFYWKIFAAIALLYNPIITIHLSKEIWTVINVFTIGFYLYFPIWFSKLNSSEKDV